MSTASIGKGFIYAILAYFIWGFLPLYWKLLVAIDSMHILAFRILFSLLLVSVILLLMKNYAWLTVFRDRKKRWFMIMTGLLICSNWGLYIWAVNSGHTLATSLGYYMNPLVSICLGLMFFREKLKPLQWVAVALAFTGVLLLTVLSGSLPWISLAIAITFGLYGMIKKTVSLSALESLGAETFASIPVGILLLCFSFQGPYPVFLGFKSISYFSAIPIHTWILLFFCGVATMLPLYLFAQGVKILPLSAIGFCQFLSPTITFVLGVFVFKEAFPPYQLAVFLIIWTAVILYIISLRPGQKPVSKPGAKVAN